MLYLDFEELEGAPDLFVGDLPADSDEMCLMPLFASAGRLAIMETV